jgi:hypothetical protein
MHLIYFDENKYSKDFPYFYIGGIILPDHKLTELEKIITQIQYNFFGTSILMRDTELHGIDMFQGKGHFKGRRLSDRIQLFRDVATFLIHNSIPVRLVCIDVKQHREKYTYPQPEYNLGLMLVLEHFSDYLEKIDDIGIVFGDYEKDEITRSILDFSQFKHDGKSRMYSGRPLGRLKDTIYFTHSHHSRFLQVADVVIYLANCYENHHGMERTKWHDVETQKMWEEIKDNTDFAMKHWPK